MFTAKMRSDNRKTPQMYKVKYLTFDECKALTNHVNVLDRNGNIASVKVTTIKTWKRKPEIEIHCKYGLYEYFTETVYPDEQQTFFVKIISD